MLKKKAHVGEVGSLKGSKQTNYLKKEARKEMTKYYQKQTIASRSCSAKMYLTSNHNTQIHTQTCNIESEQGLISGAVLLHHYLQFT